MKRNTLYTVNRANQPAFMYKENRNLFDLGGTTAGGADVLGSFISNMGNKTPDFSGIASAASGAASSGGGGIAGALGGLVGGGGGIGGALKGAVGAMGGISGIGSAVGGAIGNLIGGGYSSGVGNALGSIGKVASVIPGPWGAAISGGLQVLGGGVNALFGSKVDAKRLGEANKTMSELNSFTSNATSLDDIKGPAATASVAGIYKGGIWNKSAKKQQAELEERMRNARQFAGRSVSNNVENLVDDQMNDALANYAAYGGPLGDSFGGALGLMQQNKYIDAINNRSNAITKGLEAIAQQQPTTFTNRFDAGGFVNNFMQDPVAAAMNYIQQRDAEEAQAEAQAAQEAREQEFNNLQTRLMNAETQNQGLQALLEDQGRSIASLQEAQNAALFTPSSAASDSNPDNWKTSAIATAREVAGDDNYSSLKNFIKGQEGFRSKAYWLKGEKAPTIGYGFHMVYPGTNRPVRMGDTITQEEAEQGLTTVLRGIDRDLSKKVPNWDKLTSYQRDALRDLAYGTGTGGAHFRKNSKLMTALRNEDWEEAERNLVSRSIKNPQYNKALLRRSRQRQDMFREGKYAEGGKFGGGSFYGSGAGGGWDEPTSDTYNVGNFNQAFDAAVADGLKEFTFQGRRYNTQKETNPVREYNNRWVGQGRRANKKNPSKAYDHQAGPLGGPLADVPMVIDTHIGTPERPPQLDYNPDAMERGKALPYSWSHTVDRPMFITPKKAFGGELGTNGTDFTNGLLQVNAGNTHERNPFGGVPMGLDQQGIPNLVEEGETVFNDYVFSKRLKVPNFMLKDLGLPEIKSHGKRHRLSFADVSKKLAEESEKRPNDPISMNGLKASLSKLTEIQEAERMKERAKLQNREMAMMSDMGLVAACGGKLGKKYSGEENHSSKMDRQWKLTDDNNDYYFFGNTYKPSLTSGHIPFERNRDTAQEESSPRFRAWTNYVLDNWDNDDVKNYLQALNTRAGGYMDFNDREAARNYFRRARGLDVKEGPNSGKGDHNWGFYHDTPTWLGNEADLNRAASPYRFTPYVGLDSAPEGEMGRLAQAAEDARRADENASLRAAADAEARMARLPEANGATRNNGNNNEYDPYPTWMRYAPAVGAGIFTLTDALGLTNKPDYGYASKLEAAANRAAYAPNIEAPAIGDYMRYTPFDRLFYANQMQANARATDRALMNTSGGNRGTAQAAMLANGYNTNNNLGNLYRQAEEYNRAQYERTKEFNRRTNMFNAQMGLEADMANARYRQQAAQMGLSGLAQAANMREAIDARTGAARSANITNLLNSLGNIGRENFALNQINSDRSNRYEAKANGTSYYKGTGKAKSGKIQRRKK